MLNCFSLAAVCSELAISCERFRKNKFSDDSVSSSAKSLSVSVVTLLASSAAKAIAILIVIESPAFHFALLFSRRHNIDVFLQLFNEF